MTLLHFSMGSPGGNQTLNSDSASATLDLLNDTEHVDWLFQYFPEAVLTANSG